MAWSLNENFETYNTGQLAGQGGWSAYSGQTNIVVATSPTITGAKSIGVPGTGAEQTNVLNTGSSLSDRTGHLYILFYLTRSGSGFNFRLGNISAGVRLSVDTTNGVHVYDNGTVRSAGVTLALNTWYIADYEFNPSANTLKVRVKQYGENYSAYSTAASCPSAADLATQYLNFGGGYGVWIESISTIDPYNVLAGIISSWKLDESSGNAADSVGTNTLTNSNVTYAAGKINNGAVFNSTNSVLNGGDVAKPAALTVNAWFKLAGTPNLNTVICKNYGASWSPPYASYLIRIENATTLGFYIAIGGTLRSYTPTVPTLSAGTWYMASMTYNGSKVNIYLNGVLLSSNAITGDISYSTGSLMIGNNVANEYLNGTADEPFIYGRALTPYEISKKYNAGRGNQYPFVEDLTTSIVSSWKLDESSGNAADSVGSNTGTNSNVTYSAGKINNGASFNGSSSILYLPDDPRFRKTTGSFSLSAWIKTSIATGTLCVFGNYQYNGANYGYQFSVDTGKPIIYARDGAAGGVITTHQTSCADGNWHFIVWVWDVTLGKAQIYIDGVRSTTEGSTIPIGYLSAYPTIGASKYDSSNIYQRFNGMIDEPLFFDRALDVEEVLRLNNSGSGLQYPFTTASLKDLIGMGFIPTPR